jgi:predicted dinucleotide-binding enzyme
MKIGVLGAGKVGTSLGGALADAGHEIRYGMREPSKRPGDGLSFADAVDFAEVLVVSLPYAAVDAVLSTLDLQGRVLIDTTNPIGWEGGAPLHTPPPEGSSGEHIAALTGAKVVKGFNTFGAEHARGAHLEGRPIDALLAGDHPEAIEVVASLCRDVGLRPIPAGPLRHARATEQLATLWVHLAAVGGLGRDIAFSLVQAPRPEGGAGGEAP